MSLRDKNVVVTGGSRGLGLGLVEALVDHAARVTVVARQSDALEAVRARLGVSTIAAGARLREINAQPPPAPQNREPSIAVARYVSLFNERDWLGLRALLAEDVRLQQSSHSVRTGSEDVGVFFGTYARIDGLRLAPAWLEGREVIAVFEHEGDHAPAYFMWLEWRDDRITFIRDYRYDRYVIQDAEITVPGTASTA
jgi:hypothetical protein